MASAPATAWGVTPRSRSRRSTPLTMTGGTAAAIIAPTTELTTRGVAPITAPMVMTSVATITSASRLRRVARPLRAVLTATSSVTPDSRIASPRSKCVSGAAIRNTTSMRTSRNTTP